MDESLTHGWATHRGNLSQRKVGSATRYTSKWSAGGLENYELAGLEPLYDFSALLGSHNVSSREAQLIFGVERFFNVGNLTYALEFYFFDDAKHSAKLTTKLVAGGKAAKRARAKTAVALRAKWWPEVGGKREGAYRGWVEIYDPFTFATRRIDMALIRDWAEGTARELSNQWRTHNGPGGPGFGTHMDSARTFASKVIYSANLLREYKLPLETISTVHLREPRFEVAGQMLADIAESGSALTDFDFNRLQALYA